MSDQKDPPWYDYLGAAEHAEVRRLVAEIERLQRHMRALANTSVDRDTAGIFKGMWQGSERECEQLRTEIERLTADVRWWENQYGLGQAEIERLKAARNALMWAIDYFGASDLTEKERAHGVLEIGKVLTGRPSRASTYVPNRWDESAKLRAALENKP